MNLEVGPHADSPPPRHRRLTRFICQELLYEFVNGRLHPERQRSVDDYLSGCRDSQRELESLRKGLEYAALARKVEVSPRLKAALHEFEPHWKTRLREWTLWSSQRGWRLLPYAFLFVALTLSLLLFRPWLRTTNTDLVLLEQVKTEPDILSPPADIRMPPTGVVGVAGVAAAGSPADAGVTANAAAVGAAAAGANAVELDPEPEASRLEGLLTRGDLEVQDFAHTWPAIRDKILVLGGHVAGNVDLGWLRHPNEAYFHFSLPESNRTELDLFLKTFGPVRFSAERHLRVMPEGQIRIILTVKDGENSNEAKAP